MDGTDLTNMTVGFIGGGNMANAIGTGLIKKGVLSPKNVWISARTEKTLKYWKDLGTHTTFKNGEIIQNCEIIFLAVKPHILNEALHHAHQTLSQPIDSRLFVSVILGVSLDSLYEKLSRIVSKPRIIRSMPNTPMMVGEGITVYCSKDTNSLDTAMVDKMFSSLGASESISESLMIPVGTLSGCGPAFAYLIVESLADGAVKMGVPRAVATKFAAQVLVGAGKMVLETERHPGQLKDEVCSPGGATITGVHAMETGQVRNAMINAVEAAANKAYEFNAKMNKKD